MPDAVNDVASVISDSEEQIVEIISKFSALLSVEEGLVDSREGLETASNSVSEASRTIGGLATEIREVLVSLKKIAQTLQKADTGKLVSEFEVLGALVTRSSEAAKKNRADLNSKLSLATDKFRTAATATDKALKDSDQRTVDEFRKFSTELASLKSLFEGDLLPAVQSIKKTIYAVGVFALGTGAIGFLIGKFFQ